jgi:large-conductance mechanosensitive channel
MTMQYIIKLYFSYMKWVLLCVGFVLTGAVVWNHFAYIYVIVLFILVATMLFYPLIGNELKSKVKTTQKTDADKKSAEKHTGQVRQPIRKVYRIRTRK